MTTLKRKIFFCASFIIVLLLLTINGSSLFAQQINWLTWEEAVEQSKKEPKKIFVDVYTDWCTWCKKMDETTFTDPNISRYLNENYYAVKLNAQQEKDINYKGENYQFINRGVHSFHEFAWEIMNGQMKYPTVVFIDEDLEVIQSIPGFRNPFDLELFMMYFGEDKHQSQPWFRFKKDKELGKKNSLQLPIQNRH